MPQSHDQQHRALGLELISASACLLFANGQTTERMKAAVEQLADRLGFRVNVLPRWGELVLNIEDAGGSHCEILAAEPSGMDMNKVAETMGLINQVCANGMTAAAARSALKAITQFPPVSTPRFALLAASGAAGLGVILGAAHALSLLLIAFSAGPGASLRSRLAPVSRS